MDLIKRAEIYAAIVVIILLTIGMGYFWAKATHLETALAKSEATVERMNAEGQKAKAEAIALQQSRDKITQEQEKKHATEDAAIRSRYESIIAGLRNGNKGGSGSAKSLPQPADFSNDAAANKRLSDALFGYRSEILGLLKSAEIQTKQLMECQGWIKSQLSVK